MSRTFLRGDVVLADLGKARGSVQAGIRPCVIVSNDTGNRVSQIVIVAPITRQDGNYYMPTHVDLGNVPFLDVRSTVLTEQIITIDQKYIIEKMGSLSDVLMTKIEQSLRVAVSRKEMEL